jgi:hypothetical protein
LVKLYTGEYAGTQVKLQELRGAFRLPPPGSNLRLTMNRVHGEVISMTDLPLRIATDRHRSEMFQVPTLVLPLYKLPEPVFLAGL